MKLTYLKKTAAAFLAVALVHMSTGLHAEGVVETPTLSVHQVNQDGFGDKTNQYSWSMESFKGSLYVGTLNAKFGSPSMALFFAGQPFHSNGAEIFRGQRGEDGEWSWDQVLSGGNGNVNNYGIRKLKVVGEYIYGVTGNHVSGFEVWRSFDGETWESVIEPGFGNEDNTSGRGLAAYKGYLYVGAENRTTGAEIWRRKITEDGDFAVNSSWKQVVENGLGDKGNYWFSDFVEYKGFLYAGTLNPKGAQLWRTRNGKKFKKIFDKGNGDVFNTAAMKLYVFKDQLYVGTMNFQKGASLFANVDKKGKVFEPLFIRGNGHRNNAYIWYMKEYRGRLYVGSFKTFGEFDLFSTSNPYLEGFVTETETGFDSNTHYGIRSMAVHEGRLMIGSATPKLGSATKVFEANFKD